MAFASADRFTSRLLLVAGALIAVTVGVSYPAAAQYSSGTRQYDSQQLLDRITQLETQIQTLSRAVYRGEKLPSGMGAGADSAALAPLEERIVQAETRQRDLTGQIERATFELRQIKDQLQKMQGDVDARLTALEQRGAGASADSTTTPPQPEAAAPAATGGQSAGDMTTKPTTSGTLGSMPAKSGTTGGDTATVLYESAFADIRASNFEGAEVKFSKFIADYPKHKLVSNAHYWLAETHYVRGDIEKAARGFAQGYQNYPEGPKAADSLLKLGLSLGKLGKKDDACLTFQQLKKQFPADSGVGARADQQIKTLGCAG